MLCLILSMTHQVLLIEVEYFKQPQDLYVLPLPQFAHLGSKE